MSDIQELEAKKKKALIAICTLGLSAVPWRIHYNGSKHINKELGWDGYPGFMLNCFWFVLWALAISVVMWIINIFRYIDYSYSISRYKKRQY